MLQPNLSNLTPNALLIAAIKNTAIDNCCCCLCCLLSLVGTIMMSGSGILTNGKGTRREYGDFNLDELQVSLSVCLSSKLEIQLSVNHLPVKLPITG